MTETLDIRLASGGVIQLTVDADFLSMSMADAEFVIDIAKRMRSYVGDQSPIKLLPKPAEARPPKPAVKHRATRNGSTVDWPEVAKVYVEAIAAGKPSVSTMANRFGVAKTVAQNWPTKLRTMGLLPPLGEPVVPTEAPTQFHEHVREPLQ